MAIAGAVISMLYSVHCVIHCLVRGPVGYSKTPWATGIKSMFSKHDDFGLRTEFKVGERKSQFVDRSIV